MFRMVEDLLVAARRWLCSQGVPRNEARFVLLEIDSMNECRKLNE